MSGDWKGRLKGTDWTLEGLAAWFTQEQWKVRQGEDGSYYLTSPALTACGTEGEAWTLLERTVGYVNSAAKLLEGLAPVEVDALVRTEPDGTRRISIRASVGVGAIIARGRFAATGGQLAEKPAGPSLAERIVSLLEREGPDSAVGRTLAQWDLPEQNPTSLNNILEIIRDDIWGRHPGREERRQAWEKMAQTMAPMMAMQETDFDDELRRCRGSLQDQAAVGVLARHSGSAKAVANPMNLGQAGDFVRRVHLAWLQSKC
jgi:hypothetical protein